MVLVIPDIADTSTHLYCPLDTTAIIMDQTQSTRSINMIPTQQIYRIPNDSERCTVPHSTTSEKNHRVREYLIRVRLAITAERRIT
jgi:hypothetical protein